MVELRKRKAPAEAAPAPPTKKSTPKPTAAKGKKAAATNGSSPSSSAASVGDTINLEDFGGEIETNDGEKTTLKKLVDESTGGVVLFTYPKASTPGCTTQVCLFRDSYEPLTSTGLSIYGLSRDSPKSNTTFKTKQKLPYPLLCDPSATLISAIGMKKAPSGTTRGVFVVNKEGKVLIAKAGGPAATVEAVKALVTGSSSTMAVLTEKVIGAGESKEEKEVEAGNAVSDEPNGTTAEEKKEDDVEKAEVAADVADSAEKLDEGVPPPAA